MVLGFFLGSTEIVALYSLFTILPVHSPSAPLMNVKSGTGSLGKGTPPTSSAAAFHIPSKALSSLRTSSLSAVTRRGVVSTTRTQMICRMDSPLQKRANAETCHVHAHLWL